MNTRQDTENALCRVTYRDTLILNFKESNLPCGLSLALDDIRVLSPLFTFSSVKLQYITQ